jgi:hypothetical protein
VCSLRTSANNCLAGQMTTINQRISKALAFNVNGFHHAPGGLLQVLTRAGGSVNNVSYPHEDTSTVTGHEGSGSDAPQMRIGKDPDRTWETGGVQAIKEMKIQECQISKVPLIRRLALLDTHLPGLFSAQPFSERSLP